MMLLSTIGFQPIQTMQGQRTEEWSFTKLKWSYLVESNQKHQSERKACPRINSIGQGVENCQRFRFEPQVKCISYFRLLCSISIMFEYCCWVSPFSGNLPHENEEHDWNRAEWAVTINNADKLPLETNLQTRKTSVGVSFGKYWFNRYSVLFSGQYEVLWFSTSALAGMNICRQNSERSWKMLVKTFPDSAKMKESKLKHETEEVIQRTFRNVLPKQCDCQWMIVFKGFYVSALRQDHRLVR